MYQIPLFFIKTLIIPNIQPTSMFHLDYIMWRWGNTKDGDYVEYKFNYDHNSA
jgi:hypothetical protein